MSGPGPNKIRSEYPHPERVASLKAVKSPRNPAGPFADLTWEQQRAAEKWLFKFCAKWGSDLPGWRKAILTGVAKRLAVNPPPARFGYSFRAASGGRALARQCRAAGIEHPRIVAMRKARFRVPGSLPARQIAV